MSLYWMKPNTFFFPEKYHLIAKGTKHNEMWATIYPKPQPTTCVQHPLNHTVQLQTTPNANILFEHALSVTPKQYYVIIIRR